MQYKLIQLAETNNEHNLFLDIYKSDFSLAEAFLLYPDEKIWDSVFGINTGKQVSDNHCFGSNNFSYDPTPRLMQGYLLRNIVFSEDDVILDVGGGAGSVAISLATQKVKKVISVEIDPALTAFGQMNYLNAKKKFNDDNDTVLKIQAPIEFINQNALLLEKEILDQCTVFYIARPFSREYMEIFINKIHCSACCNKRPVKIITFGWTDNYLKVFLNYYNSHWFKKEQTIVVGEMETTVWQHKRL